MLIVSNTVTKMIMKAISFCRFFYNYSNTLFLEWKKVDLRFWMPPRLQTQNQDPLGHQRLFCNVWLKIYE